MATILFELALTMYFAAAIVGVIELFKGNKTTSKIMLILGVAGFSLHTMNIIVRYVTGGYLPMANMHEASSFFSWCIVLLFFILEYRYKIGLLGSFVMPAVFVIMLSSSIFPREIKELSPVLQSSWFGIHITLAFLGDAAFAMAAGIGLMYLLQEHFVKSKHLGDLFHRLPSLQILDEINYKLISLGFPLLTLAMITGALWAQSAWGSYWRWDPKEVWSLITWFIYLLVLHIRLNVGWKGKRAAILSIMGFCIVLFTFFGVNLLLKSVHAF
jgi:cytochrome c-type biogenesis protein CcsB